MRKTLVSLFNIGVHKDDSALDKLRAQAVNIFIYLNLVFLGIYIITEIILSNQSFSHQFKINVLSFFLFCSAIIFSKYRKLNLAIFITGGVAIFAIMNLSYGPMISNSRSSPEIGLLLAFVTLLLGSKWYRIVFLISFFVMIGYITYDILGMSNLTIGLLVEDLYFVSLFFLLALGIEKIDVQLSNTLSQLEVSNNEKIKLNAELVSKNEELITFSHIMTHDLKSPLITINSFTDLINKNTTFNSPKEAQYFSFIKESAASMQTLIDEVLQFMSLGNQTFTNEPVNLNEVLAEVMSDFQAKVIEKNVKLDVGTLGNVSGNKQLVKTVIQNLVSNSIKYQPKDIDHHPKIEITGKDVNDQYHLLFRDNGIGIKEGYIPNLFEPFKRFHSTTTYKGTGLGMSICKRVMQNIGGDIELVETSSKGTVFMLKFPK